MVPHNSIQWIIYSYSSLSSTNTWAKQQLEYLQTNPFSIIIADHQTQGRGQFARKWHSPEGVNLYITFCFFDRNEYDSLRLTHLLALSVVEYLEKIGLKAVIKWPNDILVGNQKIGGILCEVVPLQETTAYLVGLGLNVNMNQDLAKHIDQPVTSILIETHKEWSRVEVFENLKEIFTKNLSIFFKSGFDPFISLSKNIIKKF